MLPSTAPLTGIFAPTSDQGWLTITGDAGDAVSFSYTQNTGVPRTAHITVLGQQVTVSQGGLATNVLVESPAAGSDSDAVTLAGAWTATANVSWLHTTSSGTGNGTAAFTIDANTGAARIGTLTIAGETLTAEQTAATAATAPVVGPAAGSGSDVVGITGAWTATANASWLHSTASGTGSGLATFTCDANTGATRTGTLTIAGQTLTVTQAAAGYVAAAGPTTLASTALNHPYGVAVNASGNVYFADSGNNAIKEWIAATQSASTLVSAGLSGPRGVAVDAAGNVYFADSGNNAIKEWIAATQTVVTLVSSGLNDPTGVAVDSWGNVYLADTGNNAVKELTLIGGTPAVSTLVSSGLAGPQGMAVDAAGNVYIADTGNNAVKEWIAATQTVSALVSSGLSGPQGAAVDGAGNVYVADTGDNAVKEWIAATQTVSTLVSGLNGPAGVAVAGAMYPGSAGDVYIADSANNAIKELPQVFLPPSAIYEGAAAGGDALAPVAPVTAPLTGVFAPASDQAWLTIGSVSGGVVPFTFTQNPGPVSRTAHISLFGVQIPVTQPPTLATLALVEGPAAGGDSVMVGYAGSWTATVNASWLHTTGAGSGPGAATFTFDANSGGTRTGTLTIAGETLTVTQAASGYVAASGAGTLVSFGLNGPQGIAADGAGNVYIADTGNGAIKEWNAATQSVTTLASGLYHLPGVALDGWGNVYFDNGSYSGSFDEWTAATQAVKTLFSADPDYLPSGLAVDASGNVFFAETNNYGTPRIAEWYVTAQIVAAVLLSGLNNDPQGVAADTAKNIYIADTYDNAVKKYNLTGGLSSLVSLVPTGLASPRGVAVDLAGNVYIADTGNGAIKEWNAATQAVSTLASSGLNGPCGLAVDASGNIYIADTGDNAVKELPRAFVPVVPFYEGAAAGSDALSAITPVSQPLTGGFAPTSDQSWLTVGSVAGGSVHFSFTQNTGTTARTAHLTVLGQQITVTQAPALATPTLMEGPAAGSDSDLVSFAGTWTASSNASWLHVTGAPSGSGSGLATFTFDANSGATRSGTLTIAGETVTVTQAGSGYAAATEVGALVPSYDGLNTPIGTAVDAVGNVYFADSYNGHIDEWNASTQAVTTLVATGLNHPYGVAVDVSGNVYFADYGNNAIKEWIAATQTVTTLVSTGLNSPAGVAVDAAGNVYFADYGNNAIKEWIAATQTVTTLVATGLNHPYGVAVAGTMYSWSSGNVYFADFGNNAVKEWNAATRQVSTLVSFGLNSPTGLAVDASGNVYISDSADNAVKEWVAATGSLGTLVSAGLNYPLGLAVDTSGDVYLCDSGNNAVEELPRAFVPAGAVSEDKAAGNDTLAAVLPATAPLTGVFAPTSDDPAWLTIGNVSADGVQFWFTPNTGPARTAHLAVLGVQIPVTQAGVPGVAGNLGVYSGGYWYINVNGTMQIAAVPAAWAAATPITGDWNGTGKTEIGLFNQATATWWLNTAGDGVFKTSETFAFGFGGSNVFPVVGDWNGGGKTEVGVYRNGAWFRDYDNSHTWDATNQATMAYLGWNDGGTNTVIPVPGEWAGDGKTEMGVYCQGVWFLDSTGSGQWDNGHTYWGWAGSLIPVVGDWTGSSAKSQFGVYNQGAWFLDYDNSHLWDAANQAALTFFGWAGAQPVVGNWGSGFQASAAKPASGVQTPMLGATQIQPAVGAAIAGGTGSLGSAASGQPGDDSGLASGIELQAAAVEPIASTAAETPPPALNPQAVDQIDLSAVTGGQVAGLPDLNASLDLLASNQLGMGVRQSVS